MGTKGITITDLLSVDLMKIKLEIGTELLCLSKNVSNWIMIIILFQSKK